MNPNATGNFCGRAIAELNPDQDLVGVAVFSLFKDATALAARMLGILVDREFKHLRLSLDSTDFAGEDFVAVFCNVPHKLPALEALQAMAAGMSVVGGIKVGWFDRAESVWRDYFTVGMIGEGLTFDSLERQIPGFARHIKERGKSINDLMRTESFSQGSKKGNP